MPSFFRLATIAALFAAALVSAVPISDPNSNPSVLQKRAGGATVVYRCTIPGTIAITFDDGPFIYTNGLLDILRSRNVKATFFFNGNTYGRIEDFAASVKRAYEDGHQVASHTWDHKDLTTLSPGEAVEELTKCQRNYTAVVWSQDTQDWAHPDDFNASYQLYEQLLNNTDNLGQPGHIVLQHEVNQVTALQVAPMAIDLALVRGYKVVTVGECLGDPKSNWDLPSMLHGNVQLQELVQAIRSVEKRIPPSSIPPSHPDEIFYVGQEDRCLPRQHHKHHLCETEPKVLDDQTSAVKDIPTSLHSDDDSNSQQRGPQSVTANVSVELQIVRIIISASEGNKDAQVALGDMYRDGKGVAQDYQAAMDWYFKAAKRGYAAAQLNVGFLYNHGQGVPGDYKQAMDWFLQAAQQGHMRSQFNICIYYEIGQGVSQDYAQAMDWFLKAAEQEHDVALFNIGLLYSKGQGVPRDYTKALEWYSKAANQGQISAKRELAALVEKVKKGVAVN
ncbi:hypothetical protein KI688_006970 [Linnemannia hyalina]|uniref:NodB homology domain-containing protein n=1 Tax=Linnemannia hyalina TaxID=64524 RepID=A0A9P7XJQ5_9FUNG|nr:hypothetical protein KI688_006970 [Linnemannia hyalina]